MENEFNPLTGLRGNGPVSAFQATQCPCRANARHIRAIIASTRADSDVVLENLQAAILRAKNIDWEGKASELFRSRLDESMRRATVLSDRMLAMQRLSQMGAA